LKRCFLEMIKCKNVQIEGFTPVSGQSDSKAYGTTCRRQKFDTYLFILEKKELRCNAMVIFLLIFQFHHASPAVGRPICNLFTGKGRQQFVSFLPTAAVGRQHIASFFTGHRPTDLQAFSTAQFVSFLPVLGRPASFFVVTSIKRI
jgi:hypothetical protein